MKTNESSFQKVLRWTDAECRSFLEKQRWPNGPICPKCGAPEPYTITRKSRTKNAVQCLYKCRACKRQFSATVGTIFEDSKIPLSKWLAAIFLMASSKKGISAHQLYRMLDLGSYRSAWFMGHRIREAMREKGFDLLAGTIEADETYIHPRTRRGHKVWHEQVQDEIEMGLRPKPKRKPPYQDNPTVFGMLERDGRVRTQHVQDAQGSTLQPLLFENVDWIRSRLMTDAHPAYRIMGKRVRHDVINHETEYVRGDVHTQGIENYWSLLKRGLVGTFHHVEVGYLPQYLNEFEYRFNRRKISDAERFVALMGQTQGRLLWYCQTPQEANPYA